MQKYVSRAGAHSDSEGMRRVVVDSWGAHLHVLGGRLVIVHRWGRGAGDLAALAHYVVTHVGQCGPGLPDGQQGGNHGSDQAPHHGQDDPEGEVACRQRGRDDIHVLADSCHAWLQGRPIKGDNSTAQGVALRVQG